MVNFSVDMALLSSLFTDPVVQLQPAIFLPVCLRMTFPQPLSLG